MKFGDPLVIFMLSMVALIGVLLLGAHQADEAGHRRAGIILVFAAVAALVALVLGPWGVLGLLLIAALYGVFLGLPVLGVVLLVRWLRHRSG